MKFTQQQKKNIYRIYINKVNKISEEVEDKSCFTPEEVVELVLESVEEYLEDL